MDVEIKVEYTEDIVKTAVRCFLKRSFGIGGVPSLIAIWVLSLISWYTESFEWVFPIALLLTAMVLYCSYYVRREALKRFAEFDEKEVTFRITDAALEVRSCMGEGNLKWNAYSKLWRFPEVWLLIVTGRNHTTLPTEKLT